MILITDWPPGTFTRSRFAPLLNKKIPDLERLVTLKNDQLHRTGVMLAGCLGEIPNHSCPSFSSANSR